MEFLRSPLPCSPSICTLTHRRGQSRASDRQGVGVLRRVCPQLLHHRRHLGQSPRSLYPRRAGGPAADVPEPVPSEWVTAIPFTTSTLASFLRESGSDARLAVVLYGISMEGMAICFTAMLWHIFRRGLILRPATSEQERQALIRFGLGALVFPVITLIGLAWPVVTLVLYLALIVYYVAERTPIVPASETASEAEG